MVHEMRAFRDGKGICVKQTAVSEDWRRTLWGARCKHDADGFFQHPLGADGTQHRCRIVGMGYDICRWQSRYKIDDSFSVSLLISKKLYSEVAVSTPANHGYFHGQRGAFTRNSDLQGEIGSLIQRDIAAYPAARRREIE